MAFGKFFDNDKTSHKDLTMRQVFSLSKKRLLPSWKQWKQLPRVLTTGERRMMNSALSLCVLSIVALGAWYVITHRVETPSIGGDYTEALVGEPQLINPLYASGSDVDSDLSRLVFSGLMKWDPELGLVNDLATDAQVSEDGKTYTIKIRDDAKFHNGDAVRAADVIFTIDAIQNPQYRSPLAVSFYGVTVSEVDDKTVAFTLQEPFAPFLSTLTVGILPSNAWADITPRNAVLASRNLEPIGSGPYRFSKFSKDKKGTILSYTLERNGDYYGDEPYIQTLTFKFYADAQEAVQALENRNVEGVGFVPPDLESEVEKNHSVVLTRPSIQRETVLFFNQDKQAIFKQAEVRKAIAMAINKQAVIDQALGGHGSIIDAPILPGMLGYHADVAKVTQDVAAANQLLTDAGYTLPDGATYRVIDPKKTFAEGEDSTSNDLQFTLTTVQNTEFVKAAQTIAGQLAAIGIRVTVSTVGSDVFYASVLEPRSYELLLTGELIGIDPDPYPFWHSSQAKVGGLNLAGYANRKSDDLLEEARIAINADDRAGKYREFQDLLAQDLPAVFLYQSTYSYAVSNKVNDVNIEHVATPSDRFADVVSWYIKTKKTLK